MSATPEIPAALRPGPRRWRMFRAVSALVLREMTTSYGRSPGGYLWAILEPVGGVAVMTIVFSFVLRSPQLGTNFPLFYATGLLPFSLYTGLSGVTANAIQYSRPLLAYPAVTFMDALVARIFLNIVTQMLIITLIFSAIIVIWDLNPVLDWGALVTAFGMMVAMGVAIGLMNCLLFTAFPVWRQVWAIFSRPLFILSGLFFIPENLPASFRDWALLNPLLHGTSEMRKAFYPTYDAVHVVAIYPFLCALVIAIFSLLFLLRYHKDIALL